MKCLAIIPARGGSKGVPRKNLRPLAGRPLIAHSIRLARACPSIERVLVSTDDAEIARVAREHGAEVPGLRPVELAGDDVPLLPVVQEMARRADPTGACPGVVVLQPTNPFRARDEVERAVAELRAHPDCEAVLSVSPARQHPYRMRRLVDGVPVPLLEGEGQAGQRQQLPTVYYFDGAIVAARREALLRQTTFWGERLRAVVVSERAGIDLDDELDFLYAEAVAAGMDALGPFRFENGTESTPAG